MPIIHARIDERLIHGQVATMWVNTLKVNRIIVVSDEVAKDEIQKSVLKMATPAGIKLSILAVEKAAERIHSGKYEEERAFVIFKNPRDCYELIKTGVKIPGLNVGNMSHREGSYHIKKSVSVSEADIQAFDQISQLGVIITAQMVPNDTPEDFMDLLPRRKR